MRLFYPALLLLLTSCDRGVSIYHTVNNNSDSTLYVCHVDSHYHYSEILSTCMPLQPLSSVTTAGASRLGRAYDRGSEFLNYLDTFSIYKDTVTRAEIKKPFRSRDQWQYRAGKKTTMTSEEHYTLSLTNEDI